MKYHFKSSSICFVITFDYSNLLTTSEVTLFFPSYLDLVLILHSSHIINESSRFGLLCCLKHFKHIAWPQASMSGSRNNFKHDKQLNDYSIYLNYFLILCISNEI